MHLRGEYRVGPELKFLANLDMMHLMERALRRAGIPYLLSEGFNPHIRMSMGTVLPVGLWGEKEYFDLEVESMAGEDFLARMNLVLPPAMQIITCREIPATVPSLMKTVNAAEYAFVIKAEQERIEEIMILILEQDEVKVQNRGKNKHQIKDLRPGILRMEVRPKNGATILYIMVSVNDPVNVRFDELLDVLGRYGVTSEFILDFWRQGNYIKQGDHFKSPLEI